MVEEKHSLKLIIKEAKLNRDVNTFSTMDPYVVMKLKGEIYKSEVCKDGGKNPSWNEEFDLTCTDPSEIVEVKVMEDGGVLTDEGIGKCQVKLSQFMHGKGILEWYVLLWKNKKAGEILIKSIWTGPSRTQEVPKILPTLMTNQQVQQPVPIV
jgi:Ca2+-dependent lipid-binding protein